MRFYQFLLVLLGCAVIVSVLYKVKNLTYHEIHGQIEKMGLETAVLTREFPPYSTTWNTSNDSLAINMVIIPFLRYGAKESTTLEREKDYKLCLRKNLAHSQVEYVHLLTINATDTLIRFKEFKSNKKMVVSEVRSVHTLRDIFDYISQNLLDRDAMIANADIYLGKGFDKINAVVMHQQRIMYSLSRHIAPEHNITCDNKVEDYFLQDRCRNYITSHDAYLFRLHKPLTEEFLQHVDIIFPSRGIEGYVMWSFVNVLNYCVLNPCSILETFHYHCSQLRNYMHRPNLDKKKYYISMPPSDDVYCLQ